MSLHLRTYPHLFRVNWFMELEEEVLVKLMKGGNVGYLEHGISILFTIHLSAKMVGFGHLSGSLHNFAYQVNGVGLTF